MATQRINTTGSSVSSSTTRSSFAATFPIPTALKSKRITDVLLYGYVVGSYVTTGIGTQYTYPSGFNGSYSAMNGWVSSDMGPHELFDGSVMIYPNVRDPGTWPGSSSVSIGYMYTPNSNYAPYIVVSYADPSPYIKNLSPSGGFVPKYGATTFSWGFGDNTDGYREDGELRQTSGAFQWRAGTTGTINSADVGTAQQYTVPAGTFTTDVVQWRVSVVSEGVPLTSDWVTLSTAEATSTAALVSPRSGYLDGAIDNTFAWSHIIDTGTQQTKFDLATSRNGSSWETTKTESTASTSTVIPGGTFDAGPLFWRVRTYNTDNVAGEWSETAQVIVIAAPDAPVVTLVENSPRPLIKWQGSGQQAFEIAVDGESVKHEFGVAKTYRVEEYLTDGQHTIGVRVQNQYGLWSHWGSVSLVVSNMAGSEITLNGYNRGYAALTWTTEGAYDKYYVYRDGELIAKTTATSYDDALTNDAHIYQVRGAYDSSGDYGLSNAVNVVVRPETTILATVDGSISVELPYSETNKRQTTVNATRQMATMYFAGSPLPSMEIAEWTDRSMTITAALKAGESTKQLMDLVGKIVCARDQYGNCVIGPLPGWSVRSFEMYTALQTTIQDVNWREAIKHDPID